MKVKNKERESVYTGNVGSSGGFKAGKASITENFTTNNKRSSDGAASDGESRKHNESKENDKSSHGFRFFALRFEDLEMEEEVMKENWGGRIFDNIKSKVKGIKEAREKPGTAV